MRIEHVTRRFGGFTAVDDVSLDIYEGEFFSLLGGSGCGKTTLLRMLAGLEMPSAGRIWIDGQDMTRTPPYDRPVNMMFQSYALFPHMNVFANVAFGLRQERAPARLSKAEIRDRVEEMLRLVELTPFARRKPDQLSGGQRQRVALARALVKNPKLLLLDEPLAALDKKLRERTQLELARIQDRVGITFVLVTHDQEEAMNLSTRIAVMREGRFEQIGTPHEIYEAPGNRFVADFVGSVNLFECRAGGDTALYCDALGAAIAVSGSVTAADGLWVGIRPEKLRLERRDDEAASASPPGAAPNRVAGRIEAVTYLGAHSTYHVRSEAGAMLQAELPMRTRAPDAAFARGEAVWVSWAADSCVLLPA